MPKEMTSLEIVIEELEQNKIQKDKFINACMIYHDEIDDDIILYDKRIEKLETLKQDLENKKKLEKNYDKLKVKIYDIKQENAKYKKAIEILKIKLNLSLNENKAEKTINAVLPIANNDMNRLTQQEYELLEEVLKDASKNWGRSKN